MVERGQQAPQRLIGGAAGGCGGVEGCLRRRGGAPAHAVEAGPRPRSVAAVGAVYGLIVKSWRLEIWSASVSVPGKVTN